MNDSSTPQPGGLEECFARLAARGLSLRHVIGLLGRLSIEPVLTAHPTESTRRTLLRQQQRIARLLIDRLDPTRTPGEQRATIERVRTELTTGWQTAGNSRDRLTVADEREHVLFFLVEVIYEVIPGLLRGGRGGAAGHLRRGRGRGARAGAAPFRQLGGRRHGRPPGRARQDHSRELPAPPPADRQSLLPRDPGARRAVEPEREPRRRVAAGHRAHRAVPEPAAGGAGRRRRRATTACRIACCSARWPSGCAPPTRAVPCHYERVEQLVDDLQVIARQPRRQSRRARRAVPRAAHAAPCAHVRLPPRHARRPAERRRASRDDRPGAREDAHGRSAAPRSGGCGSGSALERDESPSAPLDAAAKRALWVFEAMGHCSHRYGTVGHRLVRGEHGARRRRRAVRAAAGAMGRPRRWPGGRRRARRRAAVRVGGHARARRRHHPAPARRPRLPRPPARRAATARW